MRSLLILHAGLVALTVVACGDDAASYSAPVDINLEARSGAVQGATVMDEKNINTVSGNPYGAFVADARAVLGRDPGRIEVDELTVRLGAGSTGVGRIGEIFAGRVEVLFRMNDTDHTFPVGSVDIDAATGSGPIAVGVGFDATAVPDEDWSKLVGGGFKVVVRGPAAAEFASKGADADLQATFAFVAYE